MQRRIRLLWAFPLLATLLLIMQPSYAQTFRGNINGTITDPSGAVIAGAQVTATEVSTSSSHVAVSSGAGEFSFNDLPAGAYTIKVQASGFQSTEVNSVQVLAGKVYTLPVKLNLAQQADTIEVSAAALSLDTTTIAQTTTLSGNALQSTPLNGRDFTQLLGTSASFAGYNNSGSVNGMRSDQLNYTIDGTDNNDLYLQIDAVNQGGISGIAGVVYPIDALDEYSLQTTGNAESGRSPGGNLNITTKSGTNQFHGTAYYFNRNEALAVSSPFTAPGSGSSPLRNENFGGSLGGPIWKDHTFLFVTYEEQKFIIGAINQTTEPSPAYVNLALAELSKYNVAPSQVSQDILNTLWEPSLIANLPASPLNFGSSAPENGYSHNLVAKLDHNFSDRSHLSGRYYFGQGYADAPAGSFLPQYFQVVPSHISNYDVVWNYTLRPNLTNQVAAGVSAFTQGFADADHGQNLLTDAGLNTGSSVPGVPYISINGFDSIGVTPPSGRNDITGHIGDTLSWTLGKHQLRLGLEYRRAYIDLYYNFGGRGTFLFGAGGVIGPWGGDGSVTDSNVLTLADFLAGYAYQSAITLGTQERFIYTHTASGFAEDSWQVSPKLNVNLGLRYDYQQPFYTNPANTSIFDPSKGGLVVTGSGAGTPDYDYNSNKLNFSPRIGFSYQLSPSTVVRGNYGLYFDQAAGQAFYGNLGIPNGGASGVNNNPAGSEPNEAIVQSINYNAAGVPQPVWTYNQTTPIFTAAAGQPTGDNVVSIYSVTRNFKTPYAQNFGINIEQSLGHAWIVDMGYVSTGSRHNLVLQDINQSAVVPGEQLDQLPKAAGAAFTPQQISRPYFNQFPNFGVINQMNSAASSSYNALQISVRSSAFHGLTSQFSYAWSHNLDDASGFNTNPQNSLNLSGDRGNANNDIRNHFTAYLNYDIPGLAFGPQALTHGWELNSILKFQDGQPLNILSGADNSGTGENQDRAEITGPALNSDRSVVANSHAQYLNPTSFTAPALGTYGNLGRNQITGPGFGDVDLSLIKNVPLYKERVRAQFRVEMFNILNRVNLAQPNANTGSGASFGASTSTIGVAYGAPGIGAGEPYNTQLALKIIF
jgi:hypothetical protein